MSFFKALFDFSFSEFVTTRIIKILFVITILIAVFIWLAFLIAMFTSGNGVWGILAGLIGAPIGFIVHVIFIRVGYEILIVVFGIAENTRDIAWALTGGRKAPPMGPPQPQRPPQPQYPQYAQQPPQVRPQPPSAQPQQQSPYPQYPPYQPPQQPPQQPSSGPPPYTPPSQPPKA